MMITSKDRSFSSYTEYFNYMADTMGQPHLHKSFESTTLFSDGIRLHLDVYECDKNAPTIVFIPGTALYALCYAEFMYKLGTAGFNVIGFDPRGHGQSEGVRGDYTIQELLRDSMNVVTYAIERFNEEVSFAGSSQGGIIALYMAAQDERLRSVVCQNFADLTAEESVSLTRHPRLFKYMKMILSRAGELLPNAMIPVSTYIDVEKIPVKHFGNARKFIETDPLTLKHISMRALQSLGHTQLSKPMEEIKVPVMVFQGDNDNIFPVSYTEKLFNKLQCPKKMMVFQGLTHALMHDNVDEILPEITGWLRSVHQIN